jgi:hypothetical protein
MRLTLLSLALLALSAPSITTPKKVTTPKKISDDSAWLAKAPTIAVPAGYGRYCSLSYPEGGWAFGAKGPNDDPCADMLKSSPGGTIARAGLWSMSGPNNVVYRCGGGVGLLKDDGSKAIDAAYKDSLGKKNCVITVAPKELAIFDAPVDPTNDEVKWGRGFNFARGYVVKDNSGFEVHHVNYKGNYANYNGHDGFDWKMPTGTVIRSVAAGVVLSTRARDISWYIDNNKCPTGSTNLQNEAYVLHVVGSGAYREIFVSYYAHLSSFAVKAGDVVTRGQKIGDSGSTGCSSAPHLHLTISRFSNTAVAHRRDFTIPATEDYDKDTPIDPYGFSWSAKAGFDPWAWRGFDKGQGALSIDLWRSGQELVRD